MVYLMLILSFSPPSLQDAQKLLESLRRASEVKDDTEVVLTIEEPQTKPESLTVSVTASDTSTERLPRGIFLTQPGCVPCKRMLKNIEGLYGDETFPIQLIDTTRDGGWMKKIGIPPSAVFLTPTVFILDKDGKIHGWDGGLTCKLEGEHSKQQVLDYLLSPEHGVDINPAKEAAEMSVSVSGAEPDMFASILSSHLTGQAELAVGGLLDIEVDVPDSLPVILSKLLFEQSWSNGTITVKWAGNRTINVNQDTISFSPPATVSFRKLGLSVSADWVSTVVSADGKVLKVVLSGAPDLTINLK